MDRRVFLLSTASAWAADDSETWVLDRLDRIGGHPTQAFGTPAVIQTELGKAVQFDGVEDALFVDNHPLAGATNFTWEVIFRPESGGRPEQRFFHMQEQGSQSRFLFETRLTGDQWCLDSFVASKAGSQTLIDRKLLHPLDRWYHVAMVYDGTELRSFVDGRLELSAKVQLAPQGPGQTSIGVRYTKVDYFRGVIRLARMTRSALPPEKFLKLKA
ncbi:LamG-like jellyroll fold domain-containing protein [Bryobacter aggregatus]|uniref:LamG-like jellyroll fold domain-containing protein n=1 Tax=Bryobacter aggregatus TaxID=360054 RepID=UPI0004E1CF4C|nr:LamG-like jellyroll fold domain-containing protein [Bryobacter aggregatus]